MGSANDFLSQLETICRNYTESNQAKIKLNMNGKEYLIDNIYRKEKCVVISSEDIGDIQREHKRESFSIPDFLQSIPDFLQRYENVLNGQEARLLILHPQNPEIFLIPIGIGLHIKEEKMDKMYILINENIQK